MKSHPSRITKKISQLTAQLTPLFDRAKKIFMRHTATDLQWLIIILLLGSLFRLPFLDRPNDTVFDEVVYANYVTFILEGHPFFDIHPPFARMIFSEIAKISEPFTLTTLINKPNQLFNDFPYVPLRTGVALFGILLPLLIYALLRSIKTTPRLSGAVAFLVVIDPALIIYSRFILPDMLLLVFEFLALLAAFAAVNSTSETKARAYILLSAVSIGFAVSIKWTALAVLATISLLYLLSKRYTAILFSFGVVLFLYVAIFVSSMFSFPTGGKIDPVVVAYDTPYIANIHFPAHPTIAHALPFLMEYHEAMLDANKDPQISAHILQGSHPLSWSISKITYAFWKGPEGNRIILQGNVILWPILFFLFLFEMTWIGMSFFQSRRWPIGRDETVLLAGYLMNYLPFFVINRPMHLYHYLTALVFLFLLVPKILPRVLHCVTLVLKEPHFTRIMVAVLLVEVILNFFFIIRTIYGL